MYVSCAHNALTSYKINVIGPDNEESSMENFEKVVKKKEKKSL